MYKMNGIELTTLEFEELKLLVECEECNIPAFSQSRQFDTSKNSYNKDVVSIYKSLYSLGLVTGLKFHDNFGCSGLTLAGKDFVNDYQKHQDELKRELWSNRGFQIALSVFTIIVSALGSLVVSLLFQ